MGVWIEIISAYYFPKEKMVTPCVGVWIEILLDTIPVFSLISSLPAWECGLK